MKRMQYLFSVLLSLILLGTTQNCVFSRPIPKTIKNSVTSIQIDEEKIIIRIQTRFRPELYSVHDIFFGNMLLENNQSYRQCAEYYAHDISKHYVENDAFVIEMNTTTVARWCVQFNTVAVILFNGDRERWNTRRLERYEYKSDEYILLGRRIR